jgi:hypothetical protein
MYIEIDGYHPTEQQLELHRCECDEALFGGAMLTGKTTALVMDAVMRCLNAPGSDARIVFKTWAKLRAPERWLKKLTPWFGGHFSHAQETAFMHNGSTVGLRAPSGDGLEPQFAASRINFLYIDEVNLFSKNEYEFLKGRLCGPGRDSAHPIIRCSASPGEREDAWVKTYFVDRIPAGGVVEDGIRKDVLGNYHSHTIGYIPCKRREDAP